MKRPATPRLGWITGLIIGSGLLILCCRPARHVMVVYNPSESAPRGWYAVTATTVVSDGRYVLVRLPPTVQQLAAQRGYLPMGVPLVKNVAMARDRWTACQDKPCADIGFKRPPCRAP